MNVTLYPSWAIPAFEPPRLTGAHPDFLRVRAMLGGYARARKLSPKALRKIAMAGVRARRKQLTPEQRRQHASHAGKIGNATRWAGHVKKAKKPIEICDHCAAPLAGWTKLGSGRVCNPCYADYLDGKWDTKKERAA